MNGLIWIRMRMLLLSRLAAVAFFGAFAACGSVTQPPEDPGALIQTNSASYVLVSEEGWVTADIAYTFHNRTGGTVYLVNCLGGFALRLERWEGGSWRSVWSPALSACLSDPIVIEPGLVFSDALSVVGALPATSGFPQFDAAPPDGTYRIVWEAALSSYQPQLPFGDPLPRASRTSNPFTLRLR